METSGLCQAVDAVTSGGREEGCGGEDSVDKYAFEGAHP